MTRKRIIYGILTLLVVAIIGGVIYLNSLLPIITGYAAKNLCSAVFISGRDAKDVEAVDLNFSFIKYTSNEVDTIEKSVTSHFLWSSSKAIYREGFGTTLIRGISEEALRKITFPVNKNSVYSQDTINWPLGDVVTDSATGIDKVALGVISKELMRDSSSYHGNAFAFIVLHNGTPVVEAYKPKFNKKTKLLSWSMAKSFTNAMAGILVRQGKWKIDQPVGIEEWKSDDRSKITINDLLQMQSGLYWNEDYGNRSSVNVMLHCENDMSRYAFDQPLKYPVGTFWYYSSGTANIVSYLIRKQFGNDSLYYAFAQTELFNKTGMPDAIFEVDPTGLMVGSSYLYATARDYARFGLLYQNDGMFNGERILPEGWVKYTTSGASASKGEYGSLFWLNKAKTFPSVPENMYFCDGHDGQRIFILPTQKLVVVVLGYSPLSKGGMDCDRLLKDIINTL